MISQAELDQFYEGIVTAVREHGGMCAITSGMACVQYQVAQSTKDCDVLCSHDSIQTLFDILKERSIEGTACSYRGHITPPLDRRWLDGGWTSHFEWRAETAKAHLDVFSIAPRASRSWRQRISGLLASKHTVAEMKRTDRAKDWPFATALGSKMLADGDSKGWLHIFDADTLRDLVERVPLTAEIIQQRPCLGLLRDRDPRLDLAVFGEMTFWQHLDRHRIKLHEGHLKKYMLAVKRDPECDRSDLGIQHLVRVRHAEALLPHCPIQDYGIERLIDDARNSAAAMLAPGALDWLPKIQDHFYALGVGD